jgi:hypothetical protein
MPTPQGIGLRFPIARKCSKTLRNVKATSVDSRHQGLSSGITAMAKLDSQSGHAEKATRADLQQMLGDMDDETAVTILALEPNVAQVEEAAVWLDGGDDVLGEERRPFDAVVAKIVDLVAIEDEEPPAAAR